MYARAHDAVATSDTRLTRLSTGLKAALTSLRSLLAAIQRGTGGHHLRRRLLPANIRPGTRGQNDWGYVVRIGAEVFYDCGSAPADFLDFFCGEEGLHLCSRSWRRSWCW